MKGGYVIADFKNISIVKTNKTIAENERTIHYRI